MRAVSIAPRDDIFVARIRPGLPQYWANRYDCTAGTARPARPAPLRQQLFSGQRPADRGILDDGAEISELGEEVGKGFAHAHGGSQTYSGHTQTKHGKTHRDAVIV